MAPVPQTQKPGEALLAALRKLVAERPAGEQAALPRVPRQGLRIADGLALGLQVAAERARVLMTGQIGAGKSTELREFEHQAKKSSDFLVIHCDLEKEMSPERCGALGVMLAVFRDAWNFHQVLQKPQPVGLAQKIIEWLVEWLGAHQTDTDYLFSFGGGSFPISRSNPGNAVSVVLGKAAQHQALLERHPEEGVLPDKLVALCNDYLGYLSSLKNKPVVLLVDHVDKVRDERAAGQILVDAVSHWRRLRAALIMTAPYEYTLGSTRSSVENFWGRPLIVYPEPIPEASGEGAVPEFYRWMRSASGLEGALADGELRTLAYFSGGIPRVFVLLLAAAVRCALFAEHARVEASDVGRAISDAESDYQDYGDDAMAMVDTIVKTQQGLSQARDALRSPIALLVRPKDDGGTSFHVHPLAERSLQAVRLRRRLATARAS